MAVPRKKIAKWEIIIMLAVVILAGVAYFVIFAGTEPGRYARIAVRNYPYVYVPLHEDRDFTLAQNQAVQFRVLNGTIAFTHSDCPDQVCINMGELSRVGQSAACLPNWVTVVVVGDDGDEDIDVFI